MHKLGIIHTVSKLGPTFADLMAEFLPDIETIVVADELLLKRTVRDGGVDDVTRARLRDHVRSLADYGAEAVLVTCSSVGEAVDEIAADSPLPVIRVDRSMARRAVELGARVGVLATLETTLLPTSKLIEATAQELGRPATVVARLCLGAFEALDRGDGEEHDRLVAENLEQLARNVDVVVLAQASMARIADSVDLGGTRVLSSPRLAVQELAKRCAGADAVTTHDGGPGPRTSGSYAPMSDASRSVDDVNSRPA